MQDARYLRTQAELCLEMAEKLADPHALEWLRVKAADQLARALEIEGRPEPKLTDDCCGEPKEGEPKDSGLRRFYFQVAYNGVSYEDRCGEEFGTVQEARTYAAKVASELSRNNSHSVDVRVVAEDGTAVGQVSYHHSDRPAQFIAAPDIPRCARCQGRMDSLAAVQPFGDQPSPQADICPACGHAESEHTALALAAIARRRPRNVTPCVIPLSMRLAPMGWPVRFRGRAPSQSASPARARVTAFAPAPVLVPNRLGSPAIVSPERPSGRRR
jgi:hypothetical protein